MLAREILFFDIQNTEQVCLEESYTYCEVRSVVPRSLFVKYFGGKKCPE